MTEELNIMCNLGEGIFEDGVAEGILEGEIKKSEEIALKMLRKGKTTEEIQEWIDLPTQRIEQLASSINKN